ncbi:kinesin-like protein KIF18A [Ctenocephalides felis]|uniref:kinesin-like protein KIF18A n=1 Tax=Ctenocephalides felis TaxID=7515 RepID=UPI000E6E3A30|nr:kinesin-like protein KIF18A [Ctenocephalides felis]
MTHNNGSSSSSGSASSTTKDTKPSEERLMVAVRIRPQSEEEKNYARCVHAISANTIALEENQNVNSNIGERGGGSSNLANIDRVRSARRYRYDYVFAEDATQEQVYNLTTKPLVQDVLSGFNGTVFAYGATGSGKTHSMTGPHSDDR